MSKFKKILFFGALVLLAFFGLSYFFGGQDAPPKKITLEESRPPAESALPADEKKEISAPELSEKTNLPNNKVIPEEVMLDVPFLVQAPFAVWDPLHEDACEEASLIMLKHFLENDNNITPTSGDVEIRKMVAYEDKNNYGLSITMDQLAQIAKDYYKLPSPRVEKNITVEDIKKELAEGRPVIVPAAGKILPNPNFRNGGPNYHMLVVVGYDKTGFITNDPGTRKGEGFRYALEDLFYAIHDWEETNILNGQKAYLVFD